MRRSGAGARALERKRREDDSCCTVASSSAESVRVVEGGGEGSLEREDQGLMRLYGRRESRMVWTSASCMMPSDRTRNRL